MQRAPSLADPVGVPVIRREVTIVTSPKAPKNGKLRQTIYPRLTQLVTRSSIASLPASRKPVPQPTSRQRSPRLRPSASWPPTGSRTMSRTSCGQALAGAWYAAGAHPLRRYLEDLNNEDASTGDVVNAVSERRVFAVPLPAGRVDGLAEESDGSRRKASELDAAVSGDRTLITVIEASARGVPQHRFPSFVTVALQLWDGDPLEVWQAARRLRDAGRSRD
jgi:hypothetical protein